MYSQRFYGAQRQCCVLACCCLWSVHRPPQGSAPTLAVDNTTGCQLYLSASALQAVVSTAKSSAINVLVPGDSADQEWVSATEWAPAPLSAVLCRAVQCSAVTRHYDNWYMLIYIETESSVLCSAVQCQFLQYSTVEHVTSAAQLAHSRCSREGARALCRCPVPCTAIVLQVEHALAEQFINEFKDGTFVTTPVSHSG